MRLFDRLRALFGRTAAIISSGFLRGGFSYQNGTLASNETIFSAVSMLSGAIASAPIALREDYQRVKPAEHALAWLLEFGPNPNMTTFQFIRSIETLRDTTGAGYALKDLDGNGQLKALWLMKTEYVTPVIERDSRELYYQVTDDLSGGTVYLHNSFILAVSHISTDGINPVNPITALRSSLDYDREVKQFSIEQMQNGLRASMAIKVSGSLNQEQLDTYSDIIKRFRKSGVLYLDDGKELKELNSQNIIDPKVFEVENITVARVARVYNIPLDKFLPDKTSYNSAEQSDLNYLRDTILPMARMYEQEFSKKLLTDQDRENGLQIKFSLNGFARADMKTRGDFYMKGVRSGWFCLDDVRNLEDMPPLPDDLGQEFYISKDLIPVRVANRNGRNQNE